VHDTGSGAPGFGEGVYIGSAGGGDASDENQILDNEITRTAAECIDVKEGTRGGRIAGNRFGGELLSGVNFADSWVDMKGSQYVVEDNVGTAPSAMLKDGYQIHNVAADSGASNVFRRNLAQGPAPGVGFSVDVKAIGNVIACDNRIAGTWRGGLADVQCQ
jgi:hypothetical protein